MKRLFYALTLVLAFSTASNAVTVKFLESGTDATQDLVFWASTVGTVSSATDQKHTGPRAIKFNTNGTDSGLGATGVLSDAGSSGTFWHRAGTLSANNIINPFWFKAGTTGVMQVRQDGSGHLYFLIDGTGTTSSSSTTALTTGTWYRISWAETVTNTTTWTFKIWINSNLEVTWTNGGTLGTTGLSAFWLYTQGAANNDYWFDDLYIDDSSALTDPGAILVTNKRPNANGTTNGFTTQIGSGGSGYGSGHSPQVNEQPLSTTNGWSMVGAGSAITEEYNNEGQSTGDVDTTGGTFVGIRGWVYAKSLANETASIIVDSTLSNIALTSTITLFTQNSATPTVFPAGSGTDIGIKTTTALTTVSFYEGGVLCAYTAAVASTGTPLPLFGAGPGE